MGFGGFGRQDFEIFAIDDFDGRMGAIRANVTPKLRALGEELAPRVAGLVGGPVHAHVALHARRKVNPPDDTWVALGPNARGYKKAQHFKVAISARGLRFLFEAGPEFEDRPGFRDRFRRAAPKLAPGLISLEGLGVYADEHDDDPARRLKGLLARELADLADSLTARKDGQLVLGRGVARSEVLKMRSSEVEATALATFEALAPVYQLGGP